MAGVVVDGGEGGDCVDVCPPNTHWASCPWGGARERWSWRALLQSGFAVTYSMHAMKCVSVQKSHLKNHHNVALSLPPKGETVAVLGSWVSLLPSARITALQTSVVAVLSLFFVSFTTYKWSLTVYGSVLRK